MLEMSLHVRNVKIARKSENNFNILLNIRKVSLPIGEGLHAYKEKRFIYECLCHLDARYIDLTSQGKRLECSIQYLRKANYEENKRLAYPNNKKGPVHVSPLSETNFKFCSYGVILASLPRQNCSFLQLQSLLWLHTCAVERIPARLLGQSVHMRNFQPPRQDLTTAQERPHLPTQPAFSYEQD